MTDALDTVLRMVAEGRLTAEEAASAHRRPPGPRQQLEATGPAIGQRRGAGRRSGAARQVRVEVKERGRNVVNVRVPVALGQAAIGYVPGISSRDAERIREALAWGSSARSSR